MWTCPKCERKFKTTNQSHMCTTIDIGELFLDKPDLLVLMFDTIVQVVMGWQPNYMGPSTKSIVFTNKKAWLIIRPMKKEMDLKFYLQEKLDHPRIKKHQKYPNKYAHHIRIWDEDQVNEELFELLRMGYDYANV